VSIVAVARPGLTGSLTASRALAVAALAGVCVLAAVLRFADFAAVPTTPYYDAAVRSMTHSWRDFFYGALEPSGQISIDKTPVDLWLQVALTRVLGFSSITVRLAPALAGTLAVPLLYDLVRRGCGRAAGLAAALALAVLPVSVLTSRSDTMDSVMGALLLLAAWLVVRAPPERRAGAVVAAGAVAGLAFEVKLFESVVALPALALLAWLALPTRRAPALALGALTFVIVASAWGVVASLLPGHHPYPLGSTDGRIWNALLVYNGLHRLHGSSSAPTPLRLFDTGPPHHLGPLIGAELLCALAFGALAAACAVRSPVRDDADRRRRAVVWGLGTWLVLGTLVASLQSHTWPRYLEAFTPAVAGVLGMAIVALGRTVGERGLAALCSAAVVAALAGAVTGGAALACLVAAGTAVAAVLVLALSGGRRRAAAALLLAAALVVPATTAIRLVRIGAQDAETTGAMPAQRLHRLSAYLRRHDRRARYEVAGATIFQTVAQIVKDDRPVLTLVGVKGRPLVTPRRLARAVRRGRVRYALPGAARCGPRHRYACAPVVRWVRRHGVDVSLRAGLPHRRLLYRLRA
jgi:4-amino-4-deoxy-L-arabinose transferase-like glycosyltransferase